MVLPGTRAEVDDQYGRLCREYLRRSVYCSCNPDANARTNQYADPYANPDADIPPY